MFVLAALTAVAAIRLDLLIRTSIYCTEKPRWRSPHSPCPWLGPFFVYRARCWRVIAKGHFGWRKGMKVRARERPGEGWEKKRKREELTSGKGFFINYCSHTAGSTRRFIADCPRMTHNPIDRQAKGILSKRDFTRKPRLGQEVPPR